MRTLRSIFSRSSSPSLPYASTACLRRTRPDAIRQPRSRQFHTSTISRASGCKTYEPTQWPQARNLLQRIASREKRQLRPREFHTSTPSRAWGRNSYQYNRWQNASNLLQRWAARKTFYYEIGGIGVLTGIFYVSNLETVPISGRRRFNLFGPDSKFDMGSSRLPPEDVLRETGGKFLRPDDPRTRIVRKVLERLVPLTPMKDHTWEFYVIDSPILNAMVTPAGQVFVFTGIMKVARDEDGLAAILGHEISHKVARHPAEKFSHNILLWAAATALDLMTGTGFLGYTALKFLMSLPNSRTQELEADRMGLLLMSEACYNPRAVVAFWQRMANLESETPISWISTHPSSQERIKKIVEWLPEAEAKRQESGCGEMTRLAQGFRHAIAGPGLSP